MAASIARPQVPAGTKALVVTASDRSAAGKRPDSSGEAVAARLAEIGFDVQRTIVPDDVGAIEAALLEGAAAHRLIVTTGGTGLTPRDVTPQATLAVVDYEIPGLAEAMRAEGRRHTPLADLSRAVVGVRQATLIVNLPGSPSGATQSLEAIIAALPHALETLGGPFDHQARGLAPAGDPAHHHQTTRSTERLAGAQPSEPEDAD
jgi:molybdopterin adenylyltransferase